MTVLPPTNHELNTLDELDAFMRAGGGGLDHVPGPNFQARLQYWGLPRFEINRFLATPHAGHWGPPERSTVNEATVCIVSYTRGKAITAPIKGDPYGHQVGDLEIAGHDAAQRFEFLGDDTGMTGITAIYLPFDDLRALGAPIEANRLGLLSPSPLNAVVSSYMRAFGSPESQFIDPDMLTRNFTELVGLLLRGTLSAGVADAPGVLYSHYTRALQLMAARCLDPGLDAAAIAKGLRISERTLFKAFSAQNRKFHQSLLDIRLQRAAARLATRLPGEKIATIAFDCGFESLTTFNRTFKAKFDVSPGDFEN